MSGRVTRAALALALGLATAGCVLPADEASDAPAAGPTPTPFPAATATAGDDSADELPDVGDDAAGSDPDDAADPGVTDPAPPGSAVFGEVDRVVDGDTVVVEVDGERERVRLLRIDTPELARDDEPAECLADEATAALEALLPVGEPVLLATDVEARDQFGRLLAHVWTRATWVNAQMLRDGFAQVVTFPPNTAYDAEVLAAQQRARDAGVGLWDPTRCP